jgi:nitroimidazol reductase NimA-like FMN-containing flavoprotein (pyridoxamine 5'-phosphate oxidase superfamily)
MYHTLQPDQVNNLLLGQVMGRIACTDGKRPYIFPVSYCYDGNYIYGQTNSGTKLDLMRQHPFVCFEVDSALDMNNWQSVIVTGVFEEMTDEEVDAAREILFNRVFQLMTSSRVHAHQHEVTTEIEDSNRVKDIVYRIKIENISGRMLSLSTP